MIKFLKWIAGPIAIGLAFFAFKYASQWAQNENPGLTGTGRTAFIETAMQTCIKKQSEAPENKGLAASVLTQYCTCFVNGVADRLTNNEVKAAGTANDPKVGLAIMQPKIDAASEICLEAVAKVIGR